MSTPVLSDIGLIGLAVMGQNLVLNLESRGLRVSAYNRTAATTAAFVEAHPGKRLHGAPTLADFVASLARPRRVLVMVKAGAAVDAVIDELLPLLEPGDIVADCGNSLYTDTVRREARLTAAGFVFMGIGVSGGEEGARKGPSIMPGGPEAGWQAMRPMLEAIAARVDGTPCVAHMGPGGAGHFVKMVHNGIEYGDMQLIGEAYQLMRTAGLSAAEMAAVFTRWNEGPLQSYLIEITAQALAQQDPLTGRALVDVILDRAGQKGTGRWTLISAAEHAVPVSVMQAAVEARILSARRDLRLRAAEVLVGPAPAPLPEAEREALLARVHDALYASKIVSYAQGLDLLRAAGEAYGWNLDLGTIASVWRGGCIIRAQFLGRITEAYRADPALDNLLLADGFRQVLARAQDAWRATVADAAARGVAVPAFAAALAYHDGLRTARSPANLLQAQRDYFGAHTYERTDRPAGEMFHTVWPEVID
ncbi:MAG: 6-phosphogluconate dehydrogenase, decarboxylating [Pseudomonadota bacterium]|uniref:6-phosphogluconate dehydrogenase, decarboxylating n=1 Tax=Pseudaquabacterium rugosum TaxID=2984194 RepID=A0ABU9B7J6_9BURK